MTLVHEQNIFIASYRPERPEWTLLLVVYRSFISQPLKIGPPLILSIQKRVAGVDIFQCQGANIRQGSFDKLHLCGARTHGLSLCLHQHFHGFKNIFKDIQKQSSPKYIEFLDENGDIVDENKIDWSDPKIVGGLAMVLGAVVVMKRAKSGVE